MVAGVLDVLVPQGEHLLHGRTPDLSWPHSAISLHFKVFHKTPEFARHAPTNRWLKRDDLETKIEIYDDRVQG